jgi:hypothetical protein
MSDPLIDQEAIDALVAKGMKMVEVARELHRDGHKAVAEDVSREASWELGQAMEMWGASFSEAFVAGQWVRRYVEGDDDEPRSQTDDVP